LLEVRASIGLAITQIVRRPVHLDH
jgi:hypothetical protein